MSVAFELLSVIVRVLTSLRPIALGLNAFAIVGWDITVSEAVLLAGPAAPVSLVAAPLVVLLYTPAGVAETSNCTRQLVAGIVTRPLARLTEAEPAVAPVTVPPHVLERFGVAATVIPAGSASLNATPVRLEALLLVTVIAIREVVPSATLAGVNVFVSVGLLVKVAVALAVVPVPPFAEDTVPVVFAYAAATAAVTETVT